MKRIMIFTVLLAVCLTLHTFPVQAQENGAAVLLLEAHTGSVLSQEDADELRAVGSLAKLMTAYLAAQAMERGEITKETILTAGDAVTDVRGAVIWLEKGDSITVDELLMGLLAGNANDAAAVLAVGISGSVPDFVMDMNAAAFDLGMKSTHFTSPQGYDDEMAYSTARDMGMLACAVLKCDSLTPYLTTWRTFIRNDTVEIVNENTLTRTLEGCRGLKAAYSDDAGYCLIAACEKNGMVCVAVVLGSDSKEERFSAAKQLLTEGLGSYRLTTPALSEEFLLPLKIRGGTESAVLLRLSEIPELTIPAGAKETETVLVLPDYVQAPVAEGQIVGTVYFYHGETLLCQAQLSAEQAVPKISFSYALRKVLRFLFT